MLDSKQLQTLAAVISEQSFEKAAQSLFVTQSAVSQRIRQLEETVGQMLVVRSSPVRATTAGMAVLRHFRQLKVLEEGLFEELVPVDTTDFVTVKLAVNADSLDTWFLEALREISRRERVVLDLVVDDQTVTHEYLRSGEVQGAITSAPAGFQGLKTHVLGALEYLCVAAPGFARMHFADGFDLQAAGSAPGVIFNHRDRLHHDFLASRFGESAPCPPLHAMPSTTSFLRAILDAAAYGMVPRILAQEHLNAGTLMNLTPESRLTVPHFYQHWTLQSALCDRIAQIILGTARERLVPLPQGSSIRDAAAGADLPAAQPRFRG